MVYFDDREDCPYQMQVTKGKEKEVISLLNTLYQKTQEPGELEYYFFEDEVRALYTKDKKMAEVTIILLFWLFLFLRSVYSALLISISGNASVKLGSGK